MRISFEGEAYETFQRLLDLCTGYGVTITTLDGETFDAVLVGADREAEMGDTVLAHEVSDGEYLTLDEWPTPPRSVRVLDVCIT